MPFREFTIPKLKADLGLVIDESADTFRSIPELALPPSLSAALARGLPLALAINSEKSRSELVIGPLVYEIRYANPDRVSVFSGRDFWVDEARGLVGRYDFLISRGPSQLDLEAPVCVLVEAKNEDINSGIPQCLAEMVAAQQFNATKGKPSEVMFGVVSTGELWRFLKLEGVRAAIDRQSYGVAESAAKIYGILTYMAIGSTP